MKNLLLVFALCMSLESWAGVFKCTDASGHTFYQSAPCLEESKSIQINPKTGSSVDLTSLQQQQNLSAEQRKQEEMQQKTDELARLQALAELKKQAVAESELTQSLIKQNPLQFSAFAIPAYSLDKLPVQVKGFESRLPDIEKFRRLAAQKALATGQCQRVEADELNAKSKLDALVFLVNCSTGSSLYFNESELK